MELEDAYVGPYTSIRDGARIVRTEVEHSILLDRCVLEGVPRRLTDSLVGREARLRGNPASRGTCTVVVGDMSQVHFP